MRVGKVVSLQIHQLISRLDRYHSALNFYRSLFFPDEAINGSHPRFKTLTQNIRERRGEKITINVPIFPDTNTQTPFVEDLPPDQSNARLDIDVIA